ncbi:MAG: TolC family protein [Phycisphaerae bacterium]|nr:TolC family protein [Phycisphaerae bacterium]
MADLVAACSPRYYRQQADRDVYAIVRAKQRGVTGVEQSFDITPPGDFDDELRVRRFSPRPTTAADGELGARQRAILSSTRPDRAAVGQMVDMASPMPATQPAQAYATTTQQEEAAASITPISGPAELFVEPGRWPANVQRVDLVTALMLASVSNRQFQLGKETVYRSALSLTGAQYQFESQFFGTVDASLDQTAKDTRSGTVTSTLGFNRKFLTGGTAALNISNTLFEVFTDPTGKSAASAINLTLNQPILRGAGYRVTVEPLLQADRNATYAVRTFERLKRDLAVSVARQFYQVVQNGDAVVNERNNYVNLILARQRTSKLAEAGRLPGLQVDQARQDEYRARNRWVLAIQQYNQSVDDFRRLIGLPVDRAIVPDPASLSRLLQGGFAYEPPAVDDAVRTAMSNRLDVKTAADQVDDAVRRVYVTADALKMGLNLAASANVPTTPGVNTPAAFRTDFGQYSIGMLIDLPLDRLTERNAYRSALIDVNLSRRALTDQIDAVTQQVRQDIRNATLARNSYEIQQSSLRLAVRRVDSTNMLLQAGRADTRDLLEAQSALVEAQNSVTAALVDYHIARLALLRDMDVLQVEPAGLTYHDPTTDR